MSTHVPGFQSFFRFFASFCIGQIKQQQHIKFSNCVVALGFNWSSGLIFLHFPHFQIKMQDSYYAF